MKCDYRLALTMGGVVPRDIDDVEGLQSADYSAYQIVERNDLLFKLIDLENIKTSRVGHVPERGIVSPAYIRAAPTCSGIETRFYYWYYYGAYLNNVFNGMGAGVRQTLGSEELLGALVPVPSLEEQTRIANFLDEQTGRIDALIAEKERLLGTIEEFRLSSINRFISRGLQSSHLLADTKDEWFGKVPAHWSYCPLNYRYEIQLGKMLDEKRITGDHLRPYLRNTDVQWGYINTEALPMMDIYPEELSRYTVRSGDLLVCEGGDVGRAAIWNGSGDEIGYQKALHRVRPRSERDLPKFLYYALFDSAKRGRFEGREKATIFHLTAEAFRRYRFPFPPRSEQLEIVAHLDSVTEKLDLLHVHCEEHIARLREYRSSLISAAVTGQLDINTYQARAA